MPAKKLVFRVRPRATGGCKRINRSIPTTGGRRRRRRRTMNSKHLRGWIRRARPWTRVRGRGFWDDFKKGFSSVIKPFAKYAGPVLDVIAPEIGVPLQIGASFL